MKFKVSWKLKLGILLLLTSAAIYWIVYIVFHKPGTELFYIGIDLAFVPLEILIVVVVVEAAISSKELSERIKKLNMVIGAFFSEVGTDFLSKTSPHEENTNKMAKALKIDAKWEREDFRTVIREINTYEFSFDIGGDDESIELLVYLKDFLLSRRKFLLGLLENPNLLEHESFTDMLWAVFHLTEELEKRVDLSNLPKSDYRHLQGDLERAYSCVVSEWLKYMEHLSESYPYLFSLAVRTNPFNTDIGVEILD